MTNPDGDTELLARARADGDGFRCAYAARVALVAELVAREVAAEKGYRSTARLLEDLWRVDAGEAKRLVRHAEVLSPRVAPSGESLPALLSDTANALSAGRISGEHVRVIDTAMEKVRQVPGLPPDDVEAAEALLADAAGGLSPTGLQRVADRLVETLDPDGAAPPEPDQPAHELVMRRRRRDGAVHIDLLLHGVEGETSYEVIDALSAPARPDDVRPLSQRRAEAWCDLVAQALGPDGVATAPHRDRSAGQDADAEDADADAEDAEDADAGPECATVTVRGRALLTLTIDTSWLTEQVGHGMLDSGLPVSPQTARRLACDAGIVPMVLGTRGEPLDVGRASYPVTEPIRRAVAQRDRGCSFPGCTRRPRRCHAHHVIHWLDGGDTAVDNITLLCRYHHHLVHHGGWTVEMTGGRP